MSYNHNTCTIAAVHAPLCEHTTCTMAILFALLEEATAFFVPSNECKNLVKNISGNSVVTSTHHQQQFRKKQKMCDPKNNLSSNHVLQKPPNTIQG